LGQPVKALRNILDMKIFKTIYYIFIGIIAIVIALLIISVLPITGNIKFMVVQSGSMEPAIKMGSVVMIKPVNDYKIGDIITFGEITKIKSPTTHRIDDMKVIEGEVYYITKGDANNASDQKDVSRKEIIGKVLIAIPYLGFAIDFAKKPIGFVLIIGVPAAVIVADEVKKIIKEVKKTKEIKENKGTEIGQE
jgi:signal peptidase